MYKHFKDTIENLNNIVPTEIKPTNFKDESNTRKNYFSECFKNKPKYKIVITIKFKRKRIEKSKFKKYMRILVIKKDFLR